MSELGVRRWFTFFGSAVETVAIAGFGLAQSASAASLMYCLMKAGQSFHSSGFTANYVEVGGPDNGVLQGVGNTAATFPGFLLPILDDSIEGTEPTLLVGPCPSIAVIGVVAFFDTAVGVIRSG